VSAATAGAFIALLFAINMLSGDGELWFQWPTTICGEYLKLSSPFVLASPQ
jgi:hypothetical protein